jgi:phosphopantothenoylcysteine decarboxylase/phosphopantothenate--cysteine ligase
MLNGKKILLGVCGSIAAYKSAFLVRLLVKEGAEVKVILTRSAADFITPLTLATLSKNEVLANFYDNKGNWHNHVELGLWADVFLIAPASANSLAKMANGLCDNLLSATYLSARCQVVVAPAMDLDMWKHPATQTNIKKLEGFGNLVVPVESGELASGLNGEGRMAEPENIITFLNNFLSTASEKNNEKNTLKGKKVVITAGPTVEAIDPVRFISNHSSGKMGFALAAAFLQQGAEVTLIKGPTPTDFNMHGIKTISVTTAFQMHDVAISHTKDADVIVMAAAVADYAPEKIAATKIKKKDSGREIKLVKTPDILKDLGERKKANQVLVGFALETDNELSNAQGKLKNKNLDFIVLNSLQDKGAGFGTDTNKITIIDKQGTIKKFKLKSKADVAKDIVNKIASIVAR